MTYAQGFNHGECQAFNDRRDCVMRLPTQIRSEYDRGYWDGYCCRSVEWGSSGVTRDARAPRDVELLAAA